jgi:hypothetical protein
VEYSQFDSFDFFRTWGFAAQRPLAFSAALSGKIGPIPLEIDRLFDGIAVSERDWIPKVRTTADNIKLSFLTIGNQQFPRLPKGIFFKLMREAGYSGFGESFDFIQHFNQLHFIKLLDALEGINLPMAAALRKMARYQLRAMSYCFGVREI